MATFDGSSFPSQGSEMSADTCEAKLERAQVYKQEGNDQYAAGEHQKAVRSYHKALLYLKGIRSDTFDARGTLLGVLGGCGEPRVQKSTVMAAESVEADCYNNLAACFLLLPEQDLHKVLKYCELVIEKKPNNAKAWFRMGQAHYRLTNVGKASDCFQRANTLLEGKDPNVVRFLALCNKNVEEDRQREKTLYKDMFAKMSL